MPQQEMQRDRAAGMCPLRAFAPGIRDQEKIAGCRTGDSGAGTDRDGRIWGWDVERGAVVNGWRGTKAAPDIPLAMEDYHLEAHGLSITWIL